MNHSFKTFLICFFMTLIVFLSGCTKWKHESAKNDFVKNEVLNHLYTTSCENVMNGARQLLFTLGYDVKDNTTNSIETEWNRIDFDTDRRYLVTTHPIIQPETKNQKAKSEKKKGHKKKEKSNTTEQCYIQIQYHQNEYLEDGNVWNSNGRDFNLEYVLLGSLDPESLRNIEARAEAYATDHENDSLFDF